MSITSAALFASGVAPADARLPDATRVGGVHLRVPDPRGTRFRIHPAAP